MADENEKTDEQPQKRVLATGASGDPQNPEAGAPGFRLPPGVEDVTPPGPGETPKVVGEPQVPVENPADPSDPARRAPRK